MSLYHPSSPEPTECPPFHPTLKGCVPRDIHFAFALEPCYNAAFSAIAIQTCRALRAAEYDRTLSDLFDRLANAEWEQFRLLGELIVALGGTGKPRMTRAIRNVLPCPDLPYPCAPFLQAGIVEKQTTIDKYETLLASAKDRVVRSVIAKLLGRERRMLAQLEAVQML